MLLVWLLVLVASAVVAAVAVVTTAEWLATGTDSAGRTAGPAAGVAVAGLAFSG